MQNLELKIDNYPSERALGYYNISDFSSNAAQKGKEAAESAAAFYASSGDKLGNFQNYKIADLGREILYTSQKEITIAYKPGPNIDFRA